MQTDVFQFLFADKGVIAERGYKEYGRDDFDERDTSQMNGMSSMTKTVMGVQLSSLSKWRVLSHGQGAKHSPR